MKASASARRDQGFEGADRVHNPGSRWDGETSRASLGDAFLTSLNGWLDMIAPCPWSAHIGLSNVGTHSAWTGQTSLPFDLTPRTSARPAAQRPLYTKAERQRRDSSPWTIVQGVLAPVQFLAFAVSLILIARYMMTGQGYAVATGSILIKTGLLYAIMITGSIWEKVVFGKWLFARAFFWEDVFSMVVLSLQTTYLASLLLGLGTPAQQMFIAVAAYAAYAINAAQFLLKLRAARLEAPVADLPGLAV